MPMCTDCSKQFVRRSDLRGQARRARCYKCQPVGSPRTPKAPPSKAKTKAKSKPRKRAKAEVAVVEPEPQAEVAAGKVLVSGDAGEVLISAGIYFVRAHASRLLRRIADRLEERHGS